MFPKSAAARTLFFLSVLVSISLPAQTVRVDITPAHATNHFVPTEALGAGNVLGVLMPSCYSSQGSVDDSLALARNLGMKTLTLPIAGIMQTYDAVLHDAFAGHPRDVTEENIQSRIRGNLLMALSNKFCSLLLTTGNKSELAVGYCTLYGDMNGGLAVIADLPKTTVYRVAHWRNQRSATR